MRPQRERLPWVKQVDLPLRIPLHLVSDMEISSRGAEDALCPPASPAADCTTEGLLKQRSATCSRQRALGQLRQTSGRVVPLPETTRPAEQLPGSGALRLPPPEQAKQVPPWRGPQCQHRSHPGHLGQPAACPRGCCCISVGWLLFFHVESPWWSPCFGHQ